MSGSDDFAEKSTFSGQQNDPQSSWNAITNTAYFVWCSFQFSHKLLLSFNFLTNPRSSVTNICNLKWNAD